MGLSESDVCASRAGPGALHGSALRWKQAQRCASPRADTTAQDKLIGELRAATPQDLPQVLAANMKTIDQRLFLRLAEMSDAEEDEFERLRIRQLATAVTTTLEALLKEADAQLDGDAAAVQTLLRALASADGQFEVPVPPERVAALRTEIRGQLTSLDEGFVGTVKAYMQKASDDGLNGMVEVLRELLQAYAAERLAALVVGKFDGSVGAAVRAVIEAPPTEWDATVRTLLASEDAAVGADELMACLQDQMGEVVLGMPAGSAVQTVLAEYLNEMITRARIVAAEDA